MSRSNEAMLGPGTVSWRINREASLMAGGGRALLLQVGHPLVAAGVAQHSNYQAEPWQRLYRTMDTMIKIAFGDRETSEGASRRLIRRHGPVKGTTDDGRAYDARDTDLLVWVWATLVDTSVLVNSLIFKPLSDADRERFLSEQHLLAHACGVPEGACPPDWASFREYFDRVVADDLEVSDGAREVADSIQDPRMLPAPLGALGVKYNRALTAGLLPASLREPYGLAWDDEQNRRFRRAIKIARASVRVTPGAVRHLPASVLARPAKKKSPPRAHTGPQSTAA
jgi:uncharacterized protein (DUF2236 family)